MKKKEYLSCEFKVFLDDKEVMNFNNDGVRVIRTNALNRFQLLRVFNLGNGEIILTGTEIRRLYREMRRIRFKRWLNDFWKKVYQKCITFSEGLFK